MIDEAGLIGQRNGKKNVFKFETAVIALDTHEVLGLLTWGFTIPADKDADIEIDTPKFSKVPSDEFRGAIQKANTHFAGHKVRKPEKVEGGSKLLGGESALPP